ncbi:MAG: tRNA (adenosine(37)-N6)-threonylcarbamoyltransferase complex ATPase subunit type 1 TsaE [Ruminiclostridium sp.]|nr:tRNA (adenosine(37)-N6)-threonylcarbamoyltransferase complex ATPase subunit type 1 TsaE [Ruminiclostridium sp.]
MLKIVTHSAEETIQAGYRLGSILARGDMVCLTGGLGSGKTAFTGGIALALGIEGCITSPTFTIVNEYEGKIPLYHFDVYRIADPSEMFEIGFEEYVEGNGVVVIEWAELIKDILPAGYINVVMDQDFKTGSDVRKLSFQFIGGRYAQYEGRLGI